MVSIAIVPTEIQSSTPEFPKQWHPRAALFSFKDVLNKLFGATNLAKPRRGRRIIYGTYKIIADSYF